MDNFLNDLSGNMAPNFEEKLYPTIWKEYERVILDSLVTTFGLDFLVHDKRGGDVDTVHSVMETGTFKNSQYSVKYQERGQYDPYAYHGGDKAYREIGSMERKRFNETGTPIPDTYMPNNLLYYNKGAGPWRQTSLDHVISAHEIHDDPVRILSNIDPVSLANNPSNLRFTNRSLNSKMSDMSIDEFIQWCKDNPDKVNWNGIKGEPLPEEVIVRLREEDKHARDHYEATIAKEYYSSPQFYTDMSLAAGKRGIEMGARQAVGFLFLEIWFSCKNELELVKAGCSFKDCIKAIAKGIPKGLEKAKDKYMDLLNRFGQGFVSGLIASITTTLCNMFFTTERIVIRCIRYGYSSVIQAGTILLINPDDLFLGDQIKAATITIGAGASVIVGSYIGDIIAKTPIGKDPQIGSSLIRFSSTLVSGLLSCSMLIFLDRSKSINNLIAHMNQYATEEHRAILLSQRFEQMAATLENVDFNAFSAECNRFKQVALVIGQASSETELDHLLDIVFKYEGISDPWIGDFDEFMSEKDNSLLFD